MERTWNRVIVTQFEVIRCYFRVVTKEIPKKNTQLRRAVPGPRFEPKPFRKRCNGAIYFGCFTVVAPPRPNSRDAGLERHNLSRSRRELGWQRVVNRQIEVSYSSRHSRSYIKSLLWEL